MSTRKAGAKRPRSISVNSVASIVSYPWQIGELTQGENAININNPVEPRSPVSFQEVYDLLIASPDMVTFAARLKEAYDLGNIYPEPFDPQEYGDNQYTAAGLYEDIASDLSPIDEKASQKVQRLANERMRIARQYGMYGGGRKTGRRGLHKTGRRGLRKTRKLSRKQRRVVV